MPALADMIGADSSFAAAATWRCGCFALSLGHARIMGVQPPESVQRVHRTHALQQQSMDSVRFLRGTIPGSMGSN